GDPCRTCRDKCALHHYDSAGPGGVEDLKEAEQPRASRRDVEHLRRPQDLVLEEAPLGAIALEDEARRRELQILADELIQELTVARCRFEPDEPHQQLTPVQRSRSR